MSTHYRVVFCTCPDEDTATTLAGELVERHLAACVNLLSGVRSIYPWKGEIQCDQEVLLVIKTRKDRIDELQRFILTHHPYELPEFVVVSIEQGNQGYLEWIGEWLDY